MILSTSSDSCIFSKELPEWNRMVLYMSSNFWLLGVESHDFSHAEKDRKACKAEQIHKMTTIFTQNDHRLLL